MEKENLQLYEDEIITEKEKIRQAKLRKKELKARKNEINASDISQISSINTETIINKKDVKVSKEISNDKTISSFKEEITIFEKGLESKLSDSDLNSIKENSSIAKNTLKDEIIHSTTKEIQEALNFEMKNPHDTEFNFSNLEYEIDDEQSIHDIQIFRPTDQAFKKDEKLYINYYKKYNELIVDVQGVVKNYGKKEVLKGIDLKIYKGEKIAVVGPNGAGKSTLTEIISLIKNPTSGKVWYSFGESKKEISSKIGIQFQETSYPYYYRVMDIIKFFNEATKSNLSKEQLSELMISFQLEGMEKQRAQSLSGGQKQRLNILLAVLNNPELILLDELSTGLDVDARTRIKKFVKDYLSENEATMLIVSHNPDEIEYLAERVIVIYDGQIYQDVLVKEVIKEFGSFEKYIDYLFIVDFRRTKSERELDKNRFDFSKSTLNQIDDESISLEE